MLIEIKLTGNDVNLLEFLMGRLYMKTHDDLFKYLLRRAAIAAKLGGEKNEH